MRGGKKNYPLNALKNYKHIGVELEMMERCEEY